MTNFELQKTIHEKNLYIEELHEEINILKQKEFDYEWEKRGLLNQIERIEQKLQNALFESSILHGMVSKLNALRAEIEDLKLQIESGRTIILRTENKLKGIASERDSLVVEKENLLGERVAPAKRSLAALSKSVRNIIVNFPRFSVRISK